MRIFLDANVLFSAAKSDGAIRRLIAILARQGHALCVDGYVIEEARRNLAAKFPASISHLDDLMVKLESIPIVGAPADSATYDLPEKDRPVMAAAIMGRCDVLVTGDKSHFGALYGRRIEGVEVLSPAMLAARLPAHRN